MTLPDASAAVLADLSNFDQLPDDAIVSPKILAALLGVSEHQIPASPPLPKVKISTQRGGFGSDWPRSSHMRMIHIPRPKGGEEKAFDIPLSRPMIRCSIPAIRFGRIVYREQAKSWPFPGDSESGHLVEHREERRVLSKWGNDLRQSYRTLAQAAGVSELDVHLLMNHSLPGVNAGYITRDRLLRSLARSAAENFRTGI